MWWLAVGGAALGLAVVAALLDPKERAKRKLDKALRESRFYPVADFPDARLGKVRGTIRYTGKPTESPAGGRPCAVYCLLVEQYDTSGDLGAWLPLVERTGGVEFVVEDDSGRAVVDPANALVVIEETERFRQGASMDPPTRLVDYLRTTGKRARYRLAYEEGVLAEGDEVVVFGLGAWEARTDAAGGYRESGRQLRMIAPAGSKPLYITNDLSTVGLDWAGRLEAWADRKEAELRAAKERKQLEERNR